MIIHFIQLPCKENGAIFIYIDITVKYHFQTFINIKGTKRIIYLNCTQASIERQFIPLVLIAPNLGHVIVFKLATSFTCTIASYWHTAALNAPLHIKAARAVGILRMLWLGISLFWSLEYLVIVIKVVESASLNFIQFSRVS